MHAFPCTGAAAPPLCVHPCVAHLSHISGLNAANALRMLDLMSLGGSLEILMQVCRMDSGTILACRQKQGNPQHTGVNLKAEVKHRSCGPVGCQTSPGVRR